MAIADSERCVPREAPSPQKMDEAAFADFYRATAPALWAYVRRSSGDAALADDILQETFYRFLRTDVPAMEKASMKAYLYRIAISLLADHWRRSQRERRSIVEIFFGRREFKSAEPDGDAMRLFEKLKPQEQSLLWLAYVEGFDHQEVASALRLREKSVRVLLFRARKKLASMLRKKGLEPGLGPEEER